jgi:hypothetical protein
MTITIWPHGWSLHTLALLIAVFWFAASAGAATGTWTLDDAQTGYHLHHPAHPAKHHQPHMAAQR